LEAVEVSKEHEPWDSETLRDVTLWIMEEQNKIRERFGDYAEIVSINTYPEGEMVVTYKRYDEIFGGTVFEIDTKKYIKYRYYTITDIVVEVGGDTPIYIDVARMYDVYTDSESFSFIHYSDPEAQARIFLKKILRYDIEE